MQAKKSSCKNLLILFAFLLESCATTIPDIPTCVELNPEKAGCVKIVSGETFTIDEQHPFMIDEKPYTYWEMRPLMIQVPPYSWAEIKKFIIKVCKKYESACQQEASSWDRTINNIDDQIGLKK